MHINSVHGKEELMKDYFNDIKEYAGSHYNLTINKEDYGNVGIHSVLVDLQLDKNTKYIYEHYKSFEIVWHDDDSKYVGCIRFVSSACLEQEHKDLIETMNECYEVDLDDLEIVEDILHWYPLFYFPNGDAFCLDIRTGTIVFYEHEIYEGEKNLHGLLIAKSINELFEKWSCFHFVDIYDWTDVVNDEGINLSCELVARYK